MTTTTTPKFSVHDRTGRWSVFWREGGARYLNAWWAPPAGRGLDHSPRRGSARGEIVQEHAAACDHPRPRRAPSAGSPTTTQSAWSARVPARAPRDHRSMLAEPGTEARLRGKAADGRIMKALGDKQAAAITTAEIEKLP